MENPFSEKAIEIINKRDRWAMLVAARAWITDWYEPSRVSINIAHHGASGVHGGNDSMVLLREYLDRRVPTKALLLQQIDLELEELKAEVI